jgi:hypothetical protein
MAKFSGGNNNNDNSSSSYDMTRKRKKQQQQIEYSGRCSYLFNRQIILVYACSEHERELSN